MNSNIQCTCPFSNPSIAIADYCPIHNPSREPPTSQPEVKEIPIQYCEGEDDIAFDFHEANKQPSQPEGVSAEGMTALQEFYSSLRSLTRCIFIPMTQAENDRIINLCEEAEKLAEQYASSLLRQKENPEGVSAEGVEIYDRYEKEMDLYITCTCNEGHKSRNLSDPTCPRHSWSEDIIAYTDFMLRQRDGEIKRLETIRELRTDNQKISVDEMCINQLYEKLKEKEEEITQLKAALSKAQSKITELLIENEELKQK